LPTLNFVLSARGSGGAWGSPDGVGAGASCPGGQAATASRWSRAGSDRGRGDFPGLAIGRAVARGSFQPKLSSPGLPAPVRARSVATARRAPARLRLQASAWRDLCRSCWRPQFRLAAHAVVRRLRRRRRRDEPLDRQRRGRLRRRLRSGFRHFAHLATSARFSLWAKSWAK
jgi:hypothetical protein